MGRRDKKRRQRECDQSTFYICVKITKVKKNVFTLF